MKMSIKAARINAGLTQEDVLSKRGKIMHEKTDLAAIILAGVATFALYAACALALAAVVEVILP